MGNKILGIDHSTRSGFSFYDGDWSTWQYVMEESEESARYLEWYNVVSSAIATNKPDILVIEKPASMLNAKVTRFLSGLVAIEKMLAYSKGIKIVEYSPTTIKKSVGGNGRATKEEVAKGVLDVTSLEPKDIEEYEYYKKDGKVKKIHYDKSDATALIINYLNNE